MNRKELKEISKLRYEEARILLGNACYPGAYYLSGYSIECALKACIAKQTKAGDFPDKNSVQKAHTHDLEILFKLAGLESSLKQDMNKNKNLEVSWAMVKDWSEASRYRLNISEVEATDFFQSCFAKLNGVLPWIKKKW